MTFGFETPATTKSAKRRRAAHWLLVAAVLALQWVATPLKAGDIAPCDAIATVSIDVSQPHGLPQSNLAAIDDAAQDYVAPATGEFSDELLATSRSAHTADYGPGSLAGAAYLDLRAAFSRIFNPRAPPPPA